MNKAQRTPPTTIKACVGHELGTVNHGQDEIGGGSQQGAGD